MASAKGETGRQTHRIPSRDEGRDWQRDINKPRNAEERQQATMKLGQTSGRESPSRPQEETNAADILISARRFQEL